MTPRPSAPFAPARILLRAGSVIADGKPADVLNLYQKIIMEREQAYEAESGAQSSTPLPDETHCPLSYAYRRRPVTPKLWGGTD